MKKLLSVAAVLFTVHAWAGGGSIVVCESMMPCRIPPPAFPMDVPTLSYNTISSGSVDISVNFWLSPNCLGDPDLSMSLPGLDVPDRGQWFLGIDDWQFRDGTNFSIVWTINGCPSTNCVNGTTGSSPDVCQIQ